MKQNKKRRSRKGFTLIELIVVIAILAILAAIAIPAFSNQLKKAKDQTNEANIKILRSAAQVAIASGDTDAIAESWDGTDGGLWVPYVSDWPVNPYNKEDTGADAGYKVVFTTAEQVTTAEVTWTDPNG